MITIHSSSLSFQPAGYSSPDRSTLQSRFANNPTDDTRKQAAASTPEQIRNAIKQSGLDSQNDFPQASNSRSAKALASYTQTRNQSAQNQLDSLVSGIDLYV